MADSIADSIRKQVLKPLKDLERNKAMLKEIALRSLINIRTRTRAGFGVDVPEGKKSTLKAHKKRTRSNRKRLGSQGRLASTTAPNKSNFTSSGDTLRNLESNISKNTVEIIASSNDEIKVESNEKIGFKWLNLSNKEAQEVENIVARFIAKKL